MRCVGFDEAGYGSIEAMSGAALIERINRSGAHFVSAALGAQKGQAWFAHNAARLVPPVLCHLGAVMNFSAGTVSRAPPWAQRSGLEWAFASRRSRPSGSATPATACGRPSSWRRGSLPAALAARAQRASAAGQGASGGDRPLHRRHGPAPGDGGRRRRRRCLALLRSPIASPTPGRVSVDLSKVAAVGNEFAATLLVAEGWFGARGGFAVTGAGAAARADLRRLLCDELLSERPAS